MTENRMVFSNRTDIIKQSELYEPLLYYGSKSRIRIDYVSDIHLLHHIRYFDGDVKQTVRKIAKSLYQSRSRSSANETCVQVFLGDVSSDKLLTVDFYRQYRLQDMYRQYKRFKCSLRSEAYIQVLEQKRTECKSRHVRLTQFIGTKKSAVEELKSEINQYVSYSKVIAPKGSSESIRNYLESSYYKKRKVPNNITEKILLVLSIEDELVLLERALQRLKHIIDTECITNIVRLADFHYEPKGLLGFVILGNHEYIGFRDCDEAVDFYKKKLKPLGFRVLQNEFAYNNDVVIYGGSGFAKYNKQFNANNTVCCDAMMGNREYEIAQTTIFEQEYEVARSYAKSTGKCFICMTHYPVESCLAKFDRDAVYFSGHTHRSERYRTADKVLYADNQIGYHNKGVFDGTVYFKLATTDPARNPYSDFEDGYYQTSPDAYLQFYDYIGESIGEGKLIQKRCETGKLYVIKSQGYYGFFVINKSGLSIVNGGITKKIALSTNIEWIYDNFNIVVRKYLAVLEPLRATQLQISQELKKLGFYGTIHGLIVDIDFYNHIIVNPVDGIITFYYSPRFGQVRLFESFVEQLEFMSHSSRFAIKALEMIHEKSAMITQTDITLCNSKMLTSVENNGVLDELMTVSRRTGAYGVSRSIAPLQRLFTGHVLRDFDLRLTEDNDKSVTNRKVSLRGRIYMDKDFNEHLIIHDDLGEFLRLLDSQGQESVITIQKLRSSMSGKSLARAGWITFNIEETVKEHKGSMPIAWENAIHQMMPELIEEKK